MDAATCLGIFLSSGIVPVPQEWFLIRNAHLSSLGQLEQPSMEDTEMNKKNGSRCSFLLKLVSGLVLALVVTVPSVASAGPGQYTQNTAYKFTLCYPNTSTCQD